jgi:hypothetical protein
MKRQPCLWYVGYRVYQARAVNDPLYIESFSPTLAAGVPTIARFGRITSIWRRPMT